MSQKGDTEPVVVSEVESEISDWQTYRIESEDVSISYRVPNEWSRSTGVDEGEVFDFLLTPDSDKEIQGGSLNTPPDMTITIVPSSSEISVTDFVEEYLGGWFASYDKQSSALIDGHEALVVDDREATRPVSPPKVVVIQVGTKIVIISFGWSVLTSSDDIISSLKIGNETDTSTWKTYRNEEFGFEFKYPEQWASNEGMIDGQFYATFLTQGTVRKYQDGSQNSPPDMTVKIVQNPNGLALASFVKEYQNGWYSSYFEQKPILIDGQEVLIVDDQKASRPVSPPKVAFIYKVNNIIVITFGDSIVSESDKILSTFKFIDSTDTSTWKTYRNEEYGFEFDYPSVFVVSEHPGGTIGVVSLDSEPANFEGDARFTIVVNAYSKSFTFDQVGWVEEALVSNYKEESIMIDKHEATKRTGVLGPNVFGWGGMQHGFIHIILEDDILEIDYNSEDKRVEMYMDQILSSFKFID